MPPSTDPSPEPAARLRSLTRGVILAAAAVATIVVFVAIDSHSHSVSDTFYGMFVPEAIILAIASAALLFVRSRRRVSQ